MSDKDKKQSIFSKLVSASETLIDAQIYKAQNLMKGTTAPGDFNFGKAVTKDINYYVGSQGYYEKAGALSYEFLKQMAIKNSVISAILRTRQNRVAAYSDISKSSEMGFRIVLKDEQEALEKLKEDYIKGQESQSQSAEQQSSDQAGEMRKAEDLTLTPEMLQEAEFLDGDLDSDGSEQDAVEQLSPKELERKLKEMLKQKIQKKQKAMEQFLKNCGELKDRPFDTKKWNFDSFLRAVTWDSLVYDQIAVELVPKEAQTKDGRMNIHHFYPIDSSTIRFSSPDLRRLNGEQLQASPNILYPEEQLEYLTEKTDALKLDEEKLEEDLYKYVQVVRGRIERAFTEEELAFAVRNQITDLYMQGYGLSELETLTSLVSSHLNTEFYNKAYFQQGFSAKGILHIKQNLNRSKLEELRRHWNHLVSGNRNSFQTPIMSGMEEIQWIPLTQNHSEMEFSLWLNYLIKMICAIYQIDPAEIGYGMKEEGGGGGGGNTGDNTGQKLENSRDKGFVPFMRFLEQVINSNVIDKLDPDFRFEWVGLDEDDPVAQVGLEAQEVKFKKTVNEIRENAGLTPIPGADDLILDPVYFQWFAQFHPDGQKLMQQQQEQMMQQQEMGDPEQGIAGEDSEPEANPEQDYNVEEAQKEADHERQMEVMDKQHDQSKEMAEHTAKISKKNEKVEKSLRIEYYKLDSD